jgi:hypothetical protein
MIVLESSVTCAKQEEAIKSKESVGIMLIRYVLLLVLVRIEYCLLNMEYSIHYVQYAMPSRKKEGPVKTSPEITNRLLND